MRTVRLGDSGIEVSRLALGTPYMGPEGDNLTEAKGAALLLAALQLGISFWDTSDDYGSHPHVAQALRQVPRHRVVVASKSRQPAGAVRRILGELGTDYLDILFVHEASRQTTEAARDALQLWQDDKHRGSVRALGLSTHSTAVARLAADWPEVDVLMLPVNPAGLCTPEAPMEDGGPADMLAAAQEAAERGKGVVAMKVMGCGLLAADPLAAISFAARQPGVHSLCIGMRSQRELEDNVRLLGLAEGSDGG